MSIHPAHPVPSTGPALRCKGVEKWFGRAPNRVAALRGVDLEVRSGEVLMLVGPSGCGKTTLISVLAGVLDHDGGECAVLGVDLRSLSRRERAMFRARSVGFVFQQFNLLPSMTAEENVATQMMLQGESVRRSLERAREALAELGLNDRAGERPGRLSGGQQQRVAIARALVHGPRLLVCDEPTSALDQESGRRVMGALRGAVRSRGATAVVVTHDARILPFADRVAYMDDGRVTHVEAGQASEMREVQA